MTLAAGHRLPYMESEQMTAKITIDATPEAVFSVLADPRQHPRIDGTGWVREALDSASLTEAGQVFRMAMYHENHPDKDYEMANQVEILQPPRTIAWKPGQASAETGQIESGGWVWRYDLAATGDSQTAVTLTYDWSGATPEVRQFIQFPPFGQDHLEHSLEHLADLATAQP
jgi:uncharacterized protein YndB with AHSA1/START domain